MVCRTNLGRKEGRLPQGVTLGIRVHHVHSDLGSGQLFRIVVCRCSVRLKSHNVPYQSHVYSESPTPEVPLVGPFVNHSRGSHRWCKDPLGDPTTLGTCGWSPHPRPLPPPTVLSRFPPRGPHESPEVFGGPFWTSRMLSSTSVFRSL